MNGNGFKKDYAKALELYVKAVELGSVAAATNLANWYAGGWYETQADAAESLKWRRKAAELGDEEALYFLYERRVLGNDVGVSDAELLEMLETFVKADVVGAFDIMSEVYAEGKLGVEKDEAKAQKYRERVERVQLDE